MEDLAGLHGQTRGGTWLGPAQWQEKPAAGSIAVPKARVLRRSQPPLPALTPKPTARSLPDNAAGGLGGQLSGRGLLAGQLAGQLCSPEKDGPGDGNWQCPSFGKSA